MSLHSRICCCPGDAPGNDTCDNACSFATSYDINLIQGTFQYEHHVDVTDLDCACQGGVDSGLLNEYMVNVSFTSEGTATLTKCNDQTPCRYEARGQMTVSMDVDFWEGSHCCQAGTSELQNAGFNRVVNDVPYCLTFHCVEGTPPDGCARNLDVQAYWVIVLQICDFAFYESHAFLVQGSDPNCVPSNTDSKGVAAGGATFVKIAKIKDPATFGSFDLVDVPYGFAGIRCVDPPIGGDIEGNTQCIPCVSFRTQFGNFPLVKIEEFSEQDVPPPCTLDCSGSVTDVFASPQQAFLRTPNVQDCSSVIDPSTSQCYGIEDEWTGATAVSAFCISDCVWNGKVGGGWGFTLT